MPTTSVQALLVEQRLRVLIHDWSLKSGQRLRERRKLLGMSQEDLAGMVGVRATSISKFEYGQATPKDQVRLALAHALACEVNDIWAPLDRHYVSMVAGRAA